MADILEQLRTKHANRDNVYCWGEAMECYEREREEAANEIEALRKDRDTAFERGKDLGKSIGWANAKAHTADLLNLNG